MAATIGALAVTVWLASRRLRRYEVAGESMVPSFRPGDWLLVDSSARLFRAGDVVILPDPREPSRTLLKRISSIDLHRQAWLAGDNLDASTDSRAFGAVPLAAIEGRVLFRYWPLIRREDVGGAARNPE